LIQADLVVRNAAVVVTCAGPIPRTGEARGDIGAVDGGAVAARDGRLVFVGTQRELEDEVSALPGARILDAGGGTVLPGFCDPHTHLVFAGTREDEFARRVAGATYREIAAAGGGILSTVRSVRAASEDELVTAALPRLRRMLEHGTTSVEAKSGYGLSEEDEIKQLRAIRRLANLQPVEITPTLLAAHSLPPEFKDDRSAYLDLVVETIIPRAAREGLATACDVFFEEGVFDREESRRVLEAGRAHGLRPRIHADQLSASGGAELAGALQALSADHLEGAGPEGMRAMAEAGTVAVLLPGATFFLMQDRYADVEALAEAGVPVALATDFNPGSCYTESMPVILTLAVLKLRMTIEEAIVAATANAATALGRADQVGSLEPGKQADLIVLDEPGYRHLGYHFGVNPVRTVVKMGKVVVEGGQAGDRTAG
jgi:imidazolonepropionase